MASCNNPALFHQYTQSCIQAAHSTAWDDICATEGVQPFTDPATSLSVVEIHKSVSNHRNERQINDSWQRVESVVANWQQNAHELKKLDPTLESKFVDSEYIAKSLRENLSGSGRYIHLLTRHINR